jgi:hypothetical protein
MRYQTQGCAMLALGYGEGAPSGLWHSEGAAQGFYPLHCEPLSGRNNRPSPKTPCAPPVSGGASLAPPAQRAGSSWYGAGAPAPRRRPNGPAHHGTGRGHQPRAAGPMGRLIMVRGGSTSPAPSAQRAGCTIARGKRSVAPGGASQQKCALKGLLKPRPPMFEVALQATITFAPDPGLRCACPGLG